MSKWYIVVVSRIPERWPFERSYSYYGPYKVFGKAEEVAKKIDGKTLDDNGLTIKLEAHVESLPHFD